MKSVSKVINELCVLGAEVIYQDTHVSIHIRESSDVLTCFRPVIPVHSEFRREA